MKIYIAGPVTGLPNNNLEAFHIMAERLRAIGYEATIPHELCAGRGCKTWQDYMDICLPAVKEHDAIMMLIGSDYSKGAMLEFKEAIKHGLILMYETERELRSGKL